MIFESMLFLLLFSGFSTTASETRIDFEYTSLTKGTELDKQIPGLSFWGTAILLQVTDDMFVGFAGFSCDTAPSPFDTDFFISDALVDGYPFQYTGPIVIDFKIPVFDLSYVIGDLEGAEKITAKAFTPVPKTATMLLLASGLVGLVECRTVTSHLKTE